MNTIVAVNVVLKRSSIHVGVRGQFSSQALPYAESPAYRKSLKTPIHFHLQRSPRLRAF